MTQRLEKARALVRSRPLPGAILALGEEDIGSYAVDEARLLYWDGVGTKFLVDVATPEIFASTLHCSVAAHREKRTRTDSEIPVGASKSGGGPDLPDDIEWPPGEYFVAQINCAELAACEHNLPFPDTGWIYFFVSPSTGDGTVAYFAGDQGALARRAIPAQETFPDAKYYYDDFAKASPLSFRAFFYFHFGDEIEKVVPEAEVAELEKLLGGNFGPGGGDLELGGRPQWWQGEDEIWPDDEDARERLFLLMQFEFGEGTIHFRAPPDEVAQGKFDDAFVTYSGT